MPQIFTTSEVARPAYYDRQPVNVVINYSATRGGFVAITVGSYTPPFGYACFIESISLLLYRYAAAAPAGLTQAYAHFTTFYGPDTFPLIAYMNDNVVGHQVNDVVTSFGYMAYGDNISFTAGDGSVGGQIAFNICMKGTEFVY